MIEFRHNEQNSYPRNAENIAGKFRRKFFEVSPTKNFVTATSELATDGTLYCVNIFARISLSSTPLNISDSKVTQFTKSMVLHVTVPH